jgi:hypothetical protein
MASHRRLNATTLSHAPARLIGGQHPPRCALMTLRYARFPDRDDVIFARSERIQKVGYHLQGIGDLGSVSRLIVAGMKATADAAVTKQGRDDMRRMTKIACKRRAGPPQCVRRDFEPKPPLNAC